MVPAEHPEVLHGLAGDMVGVRYEPGAGCAVVKEPLQMAGADSH